MSIKVLMARMGHDNVQAALIYQHATSQGDRLVADKLNEQLRRDRKADDDEDDEPDDGAAGVPTKVS